MDPAMDGERCYGSNEKLKVCRCRCIRDVDRELESIRRWSEHANQGPSALRWGMRSGRIDKSAHC